MRKMIKVGSMIPLNDYVANLREVVAELQEEVLALQKKVKKLEVRLDVVRRDPDRMLLPR